MRRVRSYMEEVCRAGLGGLAWGLPVLLVVVGTFVSCVAEAQRTQAETERVEALRGQIKNAETRRAGAAESGGLWLRLATLYVGELEFAPAEDAFGRAIRLLRGTAAQAEYAEALNGMASEQLATGRVDEAKESARQALAAYETLGDRRGAGYAHYTIALALLDGRHGRESEVESAAGLADLQAAPQLDLSEMVALHLVHSDALCFQKKCADALKELDQTMEVMRTTAPEESMAMIAIWSARGFQQWKLGAMEESERSMKEALRLAHSMTGVAESVLASAQLTVMRQYDGFLKKTHRKLEAAQMEAEMVRLQQAHPGQCNGCTVSVAALALVP